MNKPSLIRDYIGSFRDPGFWIYSTWLELVTKYRRSRLGVFWVIFPAALYTLGVGNYYSHLSGQPTARFVTHLGLGYVLYRFVIMSLTDSTSTFATHSNFIMDGKVRMTDYVLRCMAKSAFYLAASIPLIVGVFAYFGNFHLEGLLISIPGILVVLLNVAWMVVIVAIFGARFPDVQEFIGSLLIFAMLFTPILWSAEDAPIGTSRGFIARLNPLFHMIAVIRAPIMGDTIEPNTYTYLAASTIVGWIFAIVVYRRYAKVTPIWI